MKKNIPNAINEIQWRKELKVEEPGNRSVFEITIKENNKVVYLNKGYAGVVNIVHSVDSFDPKTLEISGDSQAFGFGHPCIQLFSFDQLKQKLQPVFRQALIVYDKLSHNPKLKEFMESVGKVNSYGKK